MKQANKPHTFSLNRCYSESGVLKPFKVFVRIKDDICICYSKIGPEGTVIIEHNQQLLLKRFLYKHRKLN